MQHGEDKLVRLFRQFAQAPRLRKIKIDLDKMNPIPALKPFLSCENSVRSLNILNFSLLSGIDFLSALADSKNLDKLTIQFSRPDPKARHEFLLAQADSKNLDKSTKKVTKPDTKAKQSDFEFPQGKSCSVKSLKLNYHSVSMVMNMVHDKKWLSFFTMFTNLENLEISNANFSKGTGTYFEHLLEKLPLKSLSLKNCTMTYEMHQAIFHSLQRDEKSRLQDLKLEMCGVDQNSIEMITPMLVENKTLRSFQLRKLELTLDALRTFLLSVAHNHSSMRAIELRSVVLNIRTIADLDLLKDTILAMYADNRCNINKLIID